ncbi:conserved Plasmodium protein, unknown function [Plasmodium ovale]|uniref:Uncharacterized protein n=2 Tax=Plasmodium ovale TaxID=36330 RepID=A0A1A8VXD4_PLAOA|nr:conserved Plasmodium protein, unknown function [Plasmodium ovale curtisi]SBS90947.1 conserved Plasmodium protein, unknown function [Plasmodium ovale curtisi]SCP04506.1 conserved Plasmodium protein, unknown function [Plasmodium ovale]
MASAKSKFEIARNRSCTNIKENLMFSSDILKNSSTLLNSGTAVLGERNGDHDLHSFGGFKNSVESTPREDAMRNEFLDGLKYDEIVRLNRTYNSVVDNLQTNFQTTKLTNVLNFLKFEENTNINIPRYLKSSPLFVLYPELTHLKGGDAKEVMTQEREEEKGEKKGKEAGREKDAKKGEQNGVQNDTQNGDHHDSMKDAMRDTMGEVKSMEVFLRNTLNNRDIVRNKMYDYFDSEKRNMTQIRSPNELNDILMYGKGEEPSSVILHCYKNRYVSSNSNHMNNEMSTLNTLKKQKMLIVDKNERGDNIMLTHGNAKKKINLLKMGKEIDVDSNGTLNNHCGNYGEKKNKNVLTNEGEFHISLVDTSNRMATLKTFDLKSNKEVKKDKNIFPTKKKIVKDVQVQTNDDDFESAHAINDFDSDIAHVLNILNKKRANAEGEHSADPAVRADAEKKTSYKISYMKENDLDESVSSTDDSYRSCSSESTEKKKGFEEKGEMAYRATGETTQGKTTRSENKYDLIQEIINYNKCVKQGIPYEALRGLCKNGSAFAPYPRTSYKCNSAHGAKEANTRIARESHIHAGCTITPMCNKGESIWRPGYIFGKTGVYDNYGDRGKFMDIAKIAARKTSPLAHYPFKIANGRWISPVEIQASLHHKMNYFPKQGSPLGVYNNVRKSVPMPLYRKVDILTKMTKKSPYTFKSLGSSTLSNKGMCSKNKSVRWGKEGVGKNSSDKEKEDDSSGEQGSGSNGELEKSRIVSKYLLGRLHADEEKVLYEKEKFQKTFAGLLQRRNALRGSRACENFHYLPKSYSDKFSSNESDGCSFFANRKLWSDSDYSDNAHEKEHFPSVSFTKVCSSVVGSLKKKKKLLYKKSNCRRYEQGIEQVDISKAESAESTESAEDEKKKNVHLNFQKVDHSLESDNKGEKHFGVKKNSRKYFPKVAVMSVGETYRTAPKPTPNEKRLRSFSYKNRLEKLNILKKSIEPFKEYVSKNGINGVHINKKENNINSKDNGKVASVENEHHEKENLHDGCYTKGEDNEKCEEPMYGEDKTSSQRKDNMKVSHNADNTSLRRKKNTEEELHTNGCNKTEKISNSTTSNDSIHCNSNYKDSFNKKEYFDSQKGESNNTDNMLRIKVTIKKSTEEILKLGKNNRGTFIMNPNSNFLLSYDPNGEHFENGKTVESYSHKGRSTERSSDAILSYGEKGIFSDTEIANRRRMEKALEKSSHKAFSSSRQFLRKNNGSGGGNYLKAMQKIMNNKKSVAPPKSVTKMKVPMEDVDKREMCNVGYDANVDSSLCKWGGENEGEWIDLENIDPNKWVQKIFGDA